MGILDVFDHPDILGYLLGGAPVANNVDRPGPPADALGQIVDAAARGDWGPRPAAGPEIPPGGIPADVPLPRPAPRADASGQNPPPPPPDQPPGGGNMALTANTFGGDLTPQQKYRLAQGGFESAPGPDQNPPTAWAAPSSGGVVTPAAAATNSGPTINATQTTRPFPLAPDDQAQLWQVPPGAAPPQRGPIESQPPALPPQATPAQAPPTSMQNNWNAAFGLRPAAAPMTVSPWQNAMGALAGGLSTVGGNTAGGAFARGMGGAIGGGLRQNNLQEAQARQSRNDLFNQSSIAFRDMMAAYARDDSHALAQAKSNWLNAGAAMRLNGGRDAFSGTPYAKARDLERMLDNEDERMRKIANDRFKANGDVDAYNKALDSIEKSRNERRNARASNLGIAPDTHLNGIDQEHAWDYDKLSPQQRLQIPDGAFYKWKDKDGKTQVQQRDWLQTPPYPGWHPPQQEQQPPSQSQASTAQAYEANYGGSPDDYGTYAPEPAQEAA